MAGEAIQVTSAWWAGIGSSAPGNGALDTGARTAASASGISANEQKYELHDFECVITAGTPTANTTIDLYRIPNGNAAGRTPSPAYLHEYIGSFVLDAATGSYYIYGVAVGDPDDTYITQNNGGAALTYNVNQRTRTTGPAA